MMAGERVGYKDPAFPEATSGMTADPMVRAVNDIIMQLLPQLVRSGMTEASAFQVALFIQAAGSAIGSISAIESEGTDAFRDHPEKLKRLEVCLELAKLAQLRLEEALALIRKGQMQ